MKCVNRRALRDIRPQATFSLVFFLALLPAAVNAASDPVLSTVKVSDTTADEKANSAVVGYIAKHSATGTKTDTSLLETPQSISVVTADRIEAQRPRSINEALLYTPGIGSYGADTRSDFYMTLRGFGANYYMDGMALPKNKNYAGWRVDPYMVERLEVMRGPASVLYGQGEPGGIVNLVTKKPNAEQIREIQLQYGSLDRKQIAADLGDTLDGAGAWSYRLTTVYRDTDLQANPLGEKYFTIAPSLMWQPNKNTQLTVLGTYLDQNTDTSANFLPASGTVLSSPYGKISRDLFVGDKAFDKYDKQQISLGYEFEHRFDSTWTFRQNARYARLKLDNQTVYGAGISPFAPTGPDIVSVVAETKPEYKRFTIDNQLEAKIRSGDITHTVLAGIDYQRQRTADSLAYGLATDIDGNPIFLNVFSPTYTRADPANSLASPLLGGAEDTHGELDQTGLYLQDQLKLGNWAGILSGRFDSAKTVNEERVSDIHQSQRDSAFTGRVGVTYQTSLGLAPYVSYATSFLPTTGINANGKAFDPTEGKQAEIGVKFQPPGTEHFITLALFDLREKNVKTSDPNSSVLLERQTGEVHSRGIELESALQFTEGFRALVNATYLDVETSKSEDPDEVGKQLVVVPRMSASLWADYTFSAGPLKSLGFGGGVRYSSKTAGNIYNTFYTPSYAVADATIFYTLMNWRLSVNVTNLFDKNYVVGCGDETSCFYGAGRLILGTAAYKW